MPENKFNYFEVVTSYIVKAKNKSEAEKIILGRRGAKGEVITSKTNIDRISAVEVREMIEV
ncbi:hypothetical protein [Flavobacterium sp.]|jgi:hypothetical protein|uniref:hypothetical protein n=1 Tax=Flavobacterium sp. TaxID=239 RepID=UPI003BE44171